MRISGSIEFIEFSQLVDLLEVFFGKDITNSRHRIFGEEVNIESEDYEFFITNQSHGKENCLDSKCSYNVDGIFLMVDLMKKLKHLHDFINHLRLHKVNFSLAFYPDEEQSIELELTSPKFYEFLEEMRQAQKDRK